MSTQPRGVGALVFALAGVLIWAAHFGLMYGVQATFCTPRAVTRDTPAMDRRGANGARDFRFDRRPAGGVREQGPRRRRRAAVPAKTGYRMRGARHARRCLERRTAFLSPGLRTVCCVTFSRLGLAARSLLQHAQAAVALQRCCLDLVNPVLPAHCEKPFPHLPGSDPKMRTIVKAWFSVLMAR